MPLQLRDNRFLFKKNRQDIINNNYYEYTAKSFLTIVIAHNLLFTFFASNSFLHKEALKLIYLCIKIMSIPVAYNFIIFYFWL